MEPFPPLSPHAHTIQRTSRSRLDTENSRIKRRASSLGADPRGDTGANAIATSHLEQEKPPRTPDSPIRDKKGRGRKRRKAKKLFRRWKRVSLKHTWITPLILALTILALYFISPGEHNPLHSAIFISYPNPPLKERTNTLPAHIGNVTQYGKGNKDLAFVAFYAIVFSFTREFLMQRAIRPLAIYCGIRGRGKQSRFMEQVYTALYFGISGPLGFYVMSRTPVWFFNIRGMYEGFPHRAHEAYFKIYYLLQAAYWAQQALVLLLQLEKPRKDFKELVLHHVVTLGLIWNGWRYHFTYIGLAIYVTHDVSDFFLATSKILNYLNNIFTPVYFVVFMAIWAYLRHYINLRIIYSLFPYNIPGVPFPANEWATVGRYDLNWEDEQYKCWISQCIAFPMLVSLQAVNMFWFFLICRILARYVSMGVQKDERSDDEDEGEEESEERKTDEEVRMNGEAQMNGDAKPDMNGELKGPKVVLNGRPITPIAETSLGSSVEVSDRKATLRKR